MYKIQTLNKEEYIKRRLFSRMNATNSKNYNDYRQFLLKDSDELEKLKNALTINVTKFYRDPEKKDTYPYMERWLLIRRGAVFVCNDTHRTRPFPKGPERNGHCHGYRP